MEAAPAIDTADIVADRTETGTTLRDNRLKELEGGTIMETQACLIGNRRELRASREKREQLRHLMEFAEAHLRSRRYRTLTRECARRQSAREVADHVIGQVETAGTLGPTVAPVFPKVASVRTSPVITAIETGWYAVSIVVEEHLLLPAIDHLRRAGSGGITVGAPDYVFESESRAFVGLLASLGLAGRGGVVMRIFTDIEEARATILRRTPADRAGVAPACASRASRASSGATCRRQVSRKSSAMAVAAGWRRGGTRLYGADRRR